MHQRVRGRESVSPDAEYAHEHEAHENHKEASDDKSTPDEKSAMNHVFSMFFLSTLLLCTILFLRYDNHQIGIAARAIGDMEKILKDKDVQIFNLNRDLQQKCKEVGVNKAYTVML